jgi:hypothetical protein
MKDYSFERTEDGRYLLRPEDIGNLQASEFKVGWESGHKTALDQAMRAIAGLLSRRYGD